MRYVFIGSDRYYVSIVSFITETAKSMMLWTVCSLGDIGEINLPKSFDLIAARTGNCSGCTLKNSMRIWPYGSFLPTYANGI